MVMAVACFSFRNSHFFNKSFTSDSITNKFAKHKFNRFSSQTIVKDQRLNATLKKHRSGSPREIFLCYRTNAVSSSSSLQFDSSLMYDEDEDEDEYASPWEGAVIYRRNGSVSHLEYCTTLERLGLGKISSDISRSRASAMGIRVTKDVKDFPQGTPVQISVDVTRKKQKIRLDGIIKTVIALRCNRCGEPAAQNVFSDFALLLMENPIEEPDVINLGTIFGNSKSNISGNENDCEDEDDLIDLEDCFYFPPEEKEIDISKSIRDMVHLEITINAICDTNCKGLCLKCGTNLNLGSCNCSKQKTHEEKDYGPLRNLRDQFTQKK